MNSGYFLKGILLFFIFPMALEGNGGSTVRRIQIEGARQVREERVHSWLKTRLGFPVDSLLLRRDVQSILEGYRDAGYWQTSVSFPSVKVVGGKASVFFRVKEGLITRVDSVELIGNRNLTSERLRDAIISRSGTPLSRFRLEEDLDTILRIYENQGYPYCQIRPEVDIRPGENSVRFRVKVEEGPFVRIDSVCFKGNQRTRVEVLTREMRLTFGDPYDQRKIDQALQALRRLPFIFEVEGITLDHDANGRTSLVVFLQEADMGRVEGGLGYIPDPGEEGHSITGAFSMIFSNVLGMGRSGRVSLIRQGKESSDLELEYSEPWVGGTPISGGLVFQIRQRPGYMENQIGVEMELSLTPNMVVMLGFQKGNVRPDSSGFSRFLNGQTWDFTVGFEYDRRDNHWNPKSGVLYKGRILLGRASRGGQETSRKSFHLNLSHFFPIGRRSLVAVGIHGASINEGTWVPLEARLRLGGSATVRGYREEAFLGTRVGWANIEWRLILGRQSRGLIFFDFGILDDPKQVGSVQRYLLTGYGVGLRVESRFGLIGLDYGLSKGDGLGQGKVHFRMVNQF